MSAPQPPRRKPSRTQYSAGGIVDLGDMATPPHFPPLAYHPESDLRSKPNDFLPHHLVEADHRTRSDVEQSLDDLESANGDAFDYPSQHEQHSPLIYPSWTPINDRSVRPRKLPLDSATFMQRNGYTVTNGELRMNEIFEDDFEKVDKQDGLVYHQGHKSRDVDGHGTSYSIVWLEDDPDQLPSQVQLWEDRQTKQRRSMEGPALENAVRHMLETGSALVLERTISETSCKDNYECLLPDCQYTKTSMPSGHFYLTLRPGQQVWQLSKPFYFCLACFERLWTGDFNKTPGSPGIRIHQDTDPLETQAAESRHDELRSETPVDWDYYTNELALDGAMRELTVDDALRIPSLCSSRHAPPDIASSPLHQVLSELEDVPDDSPNSVNSRGDWIAPPNRVQHIAGFIKPGKSLSESETAAVKLWKAASLKQLAWEAHQRKTKYRREFENGESLVDRSLNMIKYQIADVDGEKIDEAAAEAIVKLPKRRFRGCSLAGVWLVMKNEAVWENEAV
ncbi:uncharacterized protein RCC_05920 [Ramularia collo-cygni]|uniref:Uncharacterized protein n=1 Tax=Ramularia collo-cygni TaxID=112498 RepID=A0A2D3VH56_9PEZI|nr:uncharacterized protein RCC_05920 [Ramularia collo-cygni]CZT20063.1 uncharacterized protein RCC_05920 [Ramularia collo-cygni]